MTIIDNHSSSFPSTNCLQPTPASFLADTAATDHFVNGDTPITSLRIVPTPTVVHVANGQTMRSTKRATLPLPDTIPHKARDGHVFPELLHPLLSIGKLCDAGCTATFTTDKLAITRNNHVVLRGTRTHDGLWRVPLPSQTHYANFTIHEAAITQAVQYLHLSLFSPTKSTLLKALANNHFVGWPAFTTDAVRRHLSLAEPTIMGHMDQQRQNVRSTKTAPALIQPDPDTSTRFH